MKKEKMNFTYEVKLGTRKYSSRGIQALPSSLLLMGMYMERWLLIPGEPLMMTLRNCQ